MKSERGIRSTANGSNVKQNAIPEYDVSGYVIGYGRMYSTLRKKYS